MACYLGLLTLPPLLLLLCPLPPVRGQTYITKMEHIKIDGARMHGSDYSSCHCKVMCAVRSDCIAATFDTQAKSCGFTTGAATSIKTSVHETYTTWFKFAYTSAGGAG